MSECSCKSCQAACRRKPGWFAPGEAEVMAASMGISLKELFDSKLMVDWWETGTGRPIYLLSPAVVGGEPGREFPNDPRGRCVFYEEGRCTVHSVKPFECAKSMCTDSVDESRIRHKDVSEMWDNERDQKQVSDLLGREPEVDVYSWIKEILWTLTT